MRPLVAVLAGGLSSRMGSEKAFARIDGRRFIDIVVGAARTAGADVVALGPVEVLAGDAGVPVIPDTGIAHRGPLNGIEAVLATHARSVIVVAADQPYLRPETISHLWAAALEAPTQAIVPIDGGVRQVTCALYPAAWADVVAEFDSIQQACDEFGAIDVVPETWTGWGEDGRSWRSLDSPEDIAAAIRDLGPPPVWSDSPS